MPNVVGSDPRGCPRLDNPGFTLIEVSLATVLGIMIVLGAMYAYGGYMTSAKFSKSRIILETIRTAIDTERVNTGQYPALGPPSQKGTIASNRQKRGKAFYAGGGNQGDCNGNSIIDATETNLPCDPFLNKSTLTAGVAAGGPPSVGGWLYDAPSGQIKINLNDAEYGVAGTQKILESNPSTW